MMRCGGVQPGSCLLVDGFGGFGSGNPNLVASPRLPQMLLPSLLFVCRRWFLSTDGRLSPSTSWGGHDGSGVSFRRKSGGRVHGKRPFGHSASRIGNCLTLATALANRGPRLGFIGCTSRGALGGFRCCVLSTCVRLVPIQAEPCSSLCCR
jgi:hypothetical protein